MNICIIGAGYVGLVSATCLAEQGNSVWCIDNDSEKIGQLQAGRMTIYEPGLQEIMKRTFAQGRLHLTTDLAEGVRNSLIVVMTVGTPMREDGSAELKYVFEAAQEIGQCLDEYKIVVVKSTVPVGTTLAVKNIIRQALSARGREDVKFDIMFSPEFLQEGSAVEDFMNPDRLVIGVENQAVMKRLKKIPSIFTRQEPNLVVMGIESAELTKYAANAMLATRISFMNEMAAFCELVGADIEEVRRGIGSDSRIGMKFLHAGLGYGGSCFPKDVRAAISHATSLGYEFTILRAVEQANRQQRAHLLNKIRNHFDENLRGRRFAVWGLGFKPNTDDIREAPSQYIIRELAAAGASIVAFDPEAIANARQALADFPEVSFAREQYEALRDADALILITEWSVFRNPDFGRIKSLLKQPVIFDGRNQYDPYQLREQGFTVYAMGRGRDEDF